LMDDGHARVLVLQVRARQRRPELVCLVLTKH